MPPNIMAFKTGSVLMICAGCKVGEEVAAGDIDDSWPITS